MTVTRCQKRGLAEVALRSISNCLASSHVKVGKVDIFGHTAAVAYQIDAAEQRRRQAVGLNAIVRLDHLDLMLDLPYSHPVRYDTLSARERSILTDLPAGCVDLDDEELVRRRVVPLHVELAAVGARDWRRGLDRASLFAPFCSRLLVLPKSPPDVDDLMTEADYYGIGVAVADRPGSGLLVEPVPYVSVRHTPARWWFSEEIYRQVTSVPFMRQPASSAVPGQTR